MNYLILILAIATLLLAHYFKMLRWKQFVEIYEKPKEDILLKSLAIGYMVNFCVPFRIGDIMRAISSGRKMKNGIWFSLATVIVDKYLDVIIVSIMFILFYFCGFSNQTLIGSVVFYFIFSVILLIFSVLAIKYSKYLKIITKKVSSIFNSEIELNLLYFSWAIISVFKDMYKKLNRKKLIINTVSMWLLYIISYYLFAVFTSVFSNGISLIDMFDTLFASNNILMPMITITHNTNILMINFPIIMAIYILTPVIILYIISLLRHRLGYQNINTVDETDIKYLKILPHVNRNEKLKFLETYFLGIDREYLKKYLAINRDISIINDYSAGSNATTMLCTNGNQSFFRKYAFAADGEKLYEQIKWLHIHEEILPLPEIICEDKGTEYCYYDMPYDNSAVGFFNYIHSMSIENSWEIMKKTLTELNEKLYVINNKKADKTTIEKYINQKVVSNVEKIKKAKNLKSLLEYDELIINGVKYRNLNSFSKYLSFEYLYDVFEDDMYSDIHGDLTIENIICMRNVNSERDHYIIDPNTGNIHDSPNLDYSKLLQSLHGGYEFLMKTRSVDVNKNEINYIYVKSFAYNELFKRYKQYLSSSFSCKKVKSIFFHEIIHWLRLMPYKIEKDGKRVAIFYSGLIIVLNEVVKMFEEN